MTRVLVLGGSGMLGHKMVEILGRRFPDTWCTVMEPVGDPVLAQVPWLQGDRVFSGLDVLDQAALEARLQELHPDVIVNCIGIIKQRAEAHDYILSLELNSLLPHRLALAAAKWGGRVIHFSTDCVFSGRDGGYTEDSPSDAEDLYGKTKYLGEVRIDNAVTLRTSIIGHELKNFASLLDWFLAQQGRTIKGFERVIYSGVTTNYLAKATAEVIAQHPDLSGLYQVTGHTLSKYDLLCALRDAYELDVTIEPESETVSDRSMIGERFIEATGLVPPPWNILAKELAIEYPQYRAWRTS